MTGPSHKDNILIVDDTPANLQMLAHMLIKQGYEVRTVGSGKRALETIRLSPPDLILLDIMMPGMDGFEVCQYLKGNELTRHIPIIFISALDASKDKVRAFTIGGVDYITKPFQVEEVLARVENHLTILDLQRQLRSQNRLLQQQNEQLNQLNSRLEEKNQQLQTLNATKDRFFSIIAQDLKGPFTTLLGFVNLMIDDLEKYSPDEINLFGKRIRSSAETLYRLLENLLTWSRIQRGVMEYHPTRLDLSEIAIKNIDFFRQKAEQKGIQLTNSITVPTYVYADYDMTDIILRNLISNAVKFTPEGGQVRLLAETKNGFIEILISDTGLGIEPGQMPELFQLNIEGSYRKIGTAGEKGIGLGLIVCRELVKMNRGEIAVQSKVGKGTIFRVTLPRETAE